MTGSDRRGERMLLFDPFSGISGDMALGALIDAGLDIDEVEKELAGLRLDGYFVSAEKKMIRGISATAFKVEIEDFNRDPGTCVERDFASIKKMILDSSLKTGIKNRALAIFESLAKAEGKVHGIEPEEVRFHEIGALDSIIDIVGIAIALEQMGIEKIRTRSVRCGTGVAETEHGILPVPAPATALLLRGFPAMMDDEPGEKVTPTGAAILAALAAPASGRLTMVVDSVGYGAGSRKGGVLPNLLRVYIGSEWGETEEEHDSELGSHGGISNREECYSVEATLDDMNPEYFPYLSEKLFEAGVMDVHFTQVIMKKGRPGVQMSALVSFERLSDACSIFLTESTTLGLRFHRVRRQVVKREIREVETKYGRIRVKMAELCGGLRRFAPEYEDCARLAREKGIPLWEVFRAAESAGVSSDIK